LLLTQQTARDPIEKDQTYILARDRVLAPVPVHVQRFFEVILSDISQLPKLLQAFL